jgi:hypothetical protein
MYRFKNRSRKEKEWRTVSNTSFETKVVSMHRQ